MRLLNLGPKSTQWLLEVGINSREQLEEIGAVAAYLAVKSTGVAVSKNLLWAIAAGLDDRHWKDLTRQEKSRLEKELKDLEENAN